MRPEVRSMASTSISERDATVCVLGHPIARRGIADVLDASGAALGSGGRLLHIATVNPEYVMQARRDDEFRRALAAADLATADGVGVAIAARILGRPAIPSRVTGLDVLNALAILSGERDAPLFFLGGGTGVGERAGRRVRETYSNARIAGSWSNGSADPRHDDEAIRRIAESGARSVLVAYGAAGQVGWIERNRAALELAGVRVAVGIGGALDYAAGTIARPPAIVRRLGLEWCYRLVREPWRWRRQLALPRFAMLVLRTAVRERLTGRTPR